MSEIIVIPQHLRAKSGEPVSQKFLDWIQSTQKKLLRAFPPGERAFCRILDKMRSRMPRRCHRRLFYTRQKYFMVADGIVFFGDFYFCNARLLVEIDGASHSGPSAAERDRWREELISAWKVGTVRLDNDRVTSGDFREVESWFIDSIADACPQSVAGKLQEDYASMRCEYPHIYEAEGILTTRAPRRS